MTAKPRTVLRSRATSTRLRASFGLFRDVAHAAANCSASRESSTSAGSRPAYSCRQALTCTAAMPGASSAQPTRTETSAVGPSVCPACALMRPVSQVVVV